MIDRSEEIKASMVDRYMTSLEFFQELYRDILADREDDSYNMLNRTVPILSKLVEDAAGDGKQIDLVISEIENSTRDDFDIEPGSPINDEDVSHHASRTLIEIRTEMRKLLNALNEDFSQFIEACSIGLAKNASVDPNDIGAEVAKYYVTEACSACGMVGSRIESASESLGDMSVCVRDVNGKRASVVIGPDLTFRGVYPLDSCNYMNYDHYVNMFRPALSAIGHVRPVGEDFIVICRYPDIEDTDGADKYDAFDITSMSPAVAMVKVAGGKGTKSSSYKLECSPVCNKVASSANPMLDSVRANAEKIRNAPMVKIDMEGSQYDGMAGTVDVDRMVLRSDHVEFPVMLKYDTGLETELWVTDDDVTTYG